ncbi:MAG: putative mitochondrial protein, conserved [Claussenomyces sp. TS43310]|nr:MAG: putative mitochondrial protein, conserved [Claussenomyces sp. TS43310]
MSRLLPPRFLRPSRRLFTTATARPAFATGPAPPRLPPKEQEEFEKLQRSSTGAFSTPRPSVTVNTSSSPSSPSASRPRPQINQSPASESLPSNPKINQSPASTLSADDVEIAAVNARVEATGKGEELHPDIRRGAKPEFEGDVNPKTGEVGGPKNEPLRWGSTGDRGDWSYNGRVTDF